MLSPPAPQVTVVTKYLFQFGFFPWNSHTVLRRYENKPYFPPRILGLEKTDGYIKYDLVQLMALFFHRSQLLVSAGCQGRRAAGGHSAVVFQEAELDAVGPGWAWPFRLVQALPPCGHACLPTALRPSPQCYGLWDHEEDPLSREPDGGRGKEEEPEEEPAPPGLQTEEGTGPQEELGTAGATTNDDIQVEVRDAPPEPQVELQPSDARRISLRFRRRTKEAAEPRGPAATEAETEDRQRGAHADTGAPVLSKSHGHCWLSSQAVSLN